MYIFAWPIQQFTIAYIDGFWLPMVIAFALTALVGYTTWHCFERRCIASRDVVAQALNNASAALGARLYRYVFNQQAR